MKTNIQWGLRLLKENFFPIKKENWRMADHVGTCVMTFNLKTDKPTDGPNNWRYRRDAIVRMIKDEQPDIICCQEVMPHMAKWLKKKIGCNYDCYGRDTFHGTRLDRSIFCNTLGNIIFYNKEKFRMVDRYAFWLSDTPGKPSATWGNTEPRNCVVVELRDNFYNNQPIVVMCTHFDHLSQDARARSAQLIVENGFDMYGGDMVSYLAGDFNANINDPELKPLQAFESHPKEGVTTFNGFTGNKKSIIDYIICNRHNHVSDIVLSSYGVPYMSDHYPVIATRFV